MRKSDSVQKRNDRKKRLKTRLASLFLLLFGCTFLVIAAQHCLVLHNWDNSEIQEYEGRYSVKAKEYWRNTNYLFILSNGDCIEIPGEFVLKNENLDMLFEEEPYELVFRYTKYQQPIKNTHTLISIVSQDNTITYVDESLMKDVIHNEMMLYTSFGLLCLCLCIFLAWEWIAKCFRLFKSHMTKCTREG